jgi:hypothetical protein
MNLTGRPIYDKNAKPVKVAAVRNSAMNETCTLRLPGCNGGTTKTVLHHLRYFGWGGTSSKPLDLLGVYACDPCHEQIHKATGRSDPHLGWEILRALGETLTRLYAAGLLHMGKKP